MAILAALFIMAGTAWPNEEYSGGSGTSQDPYRIASFEDLEALSDNPGDWGAHFLQTASIDASETQTWPYGGWSPIGFHDDTDPRPFTGIYDGNGHTIDGIYIDRDAEDVQGLFGYISGATAVIQNLGVTNVNITGRQGVGGMAGAFEDGSTIKNSFITGEVTGTDSWIGGMVGVLNGGTIEKSYSTCSVWGGSFVGGLAGIAGKSAISKSYSMGDVWGESYLGGLAGALEDSTIEKSFSTGVVTGDENYIGGLSGILAGSTVKSSYSRGNILGDSHVGGLTGVMIGSVVENCFSGGTVEGNSAVAGLAGYAESGIIENSYSMAEVTGYHDYVNGFVGFVDPVEISIIDCFWDVDAANLGESSGDDNYGATGKSTGEMITETTFIDAGWDFDAIWIIHGVWIEPVNDNYPALRWMGNVPEEPVEDDGSYLIETLSHLLWVAEHDSRWAHDYRQTAPIDAWITRAWNDGAGWSPIGNASVRFTGTYDGGGHAISGMFIHRPGTDYVGLFGFVRGGTIENLGVSSAYVIGQEHTGGLVGRVGGDTSIFNCYSEGTVSGAMEVGGLAGAIAAGGNTVQKCSSDSTVSGTLAVGGLVGYLGGSFIGESFSTGTVSGNSSIGGLTGEAENSTVEGSFSTCAVTGNDYVGGLAGFLIKSSVENSYSTGFVVGGDHVGGMAGRLWNSSVKNSYSTGAVSGINEVGGFVGSFLENNEIFNCFFDRQTSGHDEDDNHTATGKSTDEMTDMTTFTDAGWDFDNVWAIHGLANDGYPQLLWAYEEPAKDNGEDNGEEADEDDSTPPDPDDPETDDPESKKSSSSSTCFLNTLIPGR